MVNTNISGIYIIINNINNKCYIGQSINIMSRFAEHKNYHASNKYLTKAIKKYGVTNFTFDILESVSEVNQLSNLEIWWISYFISLGFTLKETLYNFTLGGEGVLGRVCSTETRQKMSFSAKGKLKSKNMKQKLSLLRTGTNHSQETKAKISLATAGKNNPNYGNHKAHTTETKRKISLSVVGDKNPMFGRKHSEETKLKIAQKASERKKET